jgi:hypothetical protein
LRTVNQLPHAAINNVGVYLDPRRDHLTSGRLKPTIFARTWDMVALPKSDVPFDYSAIPEPDDAPGTSLIVSGKAIGASPALMLQARLADAYSGSSAFAYNPSLIETITHQTSRSTGIALYAVGVAMSLWYLANAIL